MGHCVLFSPWQLHLSVTLVLGLVVRLGWGIVYCCVLGNCISQRPWYEVLSSWGVWLGGVVTFCSLVGDSISLCVFVCVCLDACLKWTDLLLWSVLRRYRHPEHLIINQQYSRRRQQQQQPHHCSVRRIFRTRHAHTGGLTRHPHTHLQWSGLLAGRYGNCSLYSHTGGLTDEVCWLVTKATVLQLIRQRWLMPSVDADQTSVVLQLIRQLQSVWHRPNA